MSPTSTADTDDQRTGAEEFGSLDEWHVGEYDYENHEQWQEIHLRIETPSALDLNTTYQQLSKHADEQGEDLEQLLDQASKHFTSDTIEPRSTILADDVIEKLIEDDDRQSFDT